MFFQRKMTPASFSAYQTAHFKASGEARWRGEGSTIYFQLPRALTNISQVLSPDLRIIVCLRQPTEKAVSAYLHNWKRFRYPEPVSILDASARANKLGPRRSSLYYQHICRWLSMYSRKQIEIILFDTLKKDPAAFVSQALRFLDLAGVATTDETPINKGADLVWEGDTLTVTHPGKRWKPQIHKSELIQLHESYLQDIERLEDLLHLGISHWKEFPKFTSRRSGEAPST